MAKIKRDNFQSTLDFQSQGIWRYHSYFERSIAPEHRFSLGEAQTKTLRLDSFDKGIDHLLIKREDLNPNGSHKDRSAAYQIGYYRQRGVERVLLSSSGNAALALAAFGARAGVEVIAFLKEDTHPEKLRQISHFSPRMILTPKPINLARYASRRYGIPNLRPSLDDTSLPGYYSLAFEIFEEGLRPDSIFVFSTSGSTLLGISRGFEKLLEKGFIDSIPSLHAVQSGNITSLSSSFGQSAPREKKKLKKKGAGRLGVKKTARKDQVVEAIGKTEGWAWWISPEKVEKWSEKLAAMGIGTSLEGAACVAAAKEAVKEKGVKRPLVIFTGHLCQMPVREDESLPSGGEYFESYNQLRLTFDEDYGKKAC